jgi:hypothetical protein
MRWDLPQPSCFEYGTMRAACCLAGMQPVRAGACVPQALIAFRLPSLPSGEGVAHAGRVLAAARDGAGLP